MAGYLAGEPDVFSRGCDARSGFGEGVAGGHGSDERIGDGARAEEERRSFVETGEATHLHSELSEAADIFGGPALKRLVG